MAVTGITIRAVQSLQPGETIWDAGHREAVRGFGVRRQRGDPVYVLKYRALGRQRFFTIGPHGSPWTPEKARREAKRLLGLVADGKDPAGAKEEARLAARDTIGPIVDDYLHAVKPTQRPKSHSETRRYLRKVWKPIHPISIHSITRRQIAARLTTIEIERGATSAARARSALSAMFKWAIGEGYDVVNPVTGTNQPGEAKSRERVLTDTELAAIWRACGDDDYGRIVRLLILTGQRRGEIGGLRREEIADAGVDGATLLPIPAIRLPPSRTKNHREHLLPLSDAALAIIGAALRETNRDFAFGRGPRSLDGPERGFGGWSKSKAALDARIVEARGEPLPHWTVHDLRRTAATLMADRLGVMPHIVEAILNHISGHKSGVAGVYNLARYSAEMREALERWTREVSRIVAGRPRAVTLQRVVSGIGG
jgi:integrase